MNTCGSCSDCKEGRPKFCETSDIYGITTNGAAAEYLLADAEWTIPLPPQLEFESAAPLMCAGSLELYLFVYAA